MKMLEEFCQNYIIEEVITKRIVILNVFISH